MAVFSAFGVGVRIESVERPESKSGVEVVLFSVLESEVESESNKL